MNELYLILQREDNFLLVISYCHFSISETLEAQLFYPLESRNNNHIDNVNFYEFSKNNTKLQISKIFLKFSKIFLKFLKYFSNF